MVDGIFLDFSTAFDRVDHKILSQKLHGFGIRGNLLKWTQSFLSDRIQRVTFGGVYSNWTSVISGVPQGFVLGLILFMLFVNDINDSLSSSFFQFADDHTIERRIRTVENQVALKKDLDIIYSWTCENNLSLNASK